METEKETHPSITRGAINEVIEYFEQREPCAEDLLTWKVLRDLEKRITKLENKNEN